MKVLKSILAALCLCVGAATLTSCEKMVEPQIPQPDSENFDKVYAQGWEQRDNQTARLSLQFEVAESTVTRSSGTAMERNIEDVNLYLFNEYMDISQHLFLHDNTSITLPVTPGEWSIYAIANNGDDMGKMTHEEVKGYKYQITRESDLTFNDALIMTYESSAEISDMKNINILFTRAVSRVDMRVRLTGAALSKVAIKRLRLVNVPKSSVLFAENAAAPATSELISYDYKSCGNGSTFSIYMLENLSGRNTAITSERDKTMNNAPSTATYVEIEAELSDAWVTYRIYLGENNTSDFNVKRNNAYDMDIEIHSADASDFRTTIRPFPMDVNVRVTSGRSSVVLYKYASAWIASELVASIALTINIDKVLIYDIDVTFEMHADKGETFGGMGAILTTYDKPLVIRIPAGSTSGSLSLTNRQTEFFMWGPTHIKVSGVTKVSNLDENNYYPSTTLFTCEYSQRWQNY